MKPWKLLSSRNTFKDKWLTLRTDHVRLSNGREIDDYHVLEFVDWVAVIALTDDGNIVLVKEYRHGCQAETIGLPAGMIEPNDTPDIAAQKELKEETGFVAREWIKLGQGYTNWAMNTNQLHYYLALGATDTGAQELDPNEDIEPVIWPWEKYRNQEGMDPQHCLHTAGLYYAERYFRQNPGKLPQKA